MEERRGGEEREKGREEMGGEGRGEEKKEEMWSVLLIPVVNFCPSCNSILTMGSNNKKISEPFML